ncbi:MAG TPA: NUDIX hydrolase N-terminal domain-containing protein [Candidatus Limnocylindria bacterium]|nr:NUDIX hydrolase N-terminal domain-containing protein [Candidatus Limnocylindria bacterium]
MQIPPSEQLRFWAHELGGMAKTGLLHAPSAYDTDRYERMLAIAEAMAALTIAADFTPDRPYLPDIGIPTPKIGCSVAAFDAGGRAVLIQRADNRRWALPGGYAEIGSPPSENALREFNEETGFEAELERLVGVYDNKRFASVSPYQFYICLFRARVTGGAATASNESLEVRLVDPADPPADMSVLQRSMLRDATAPPRQAVYQ